jgi:hypothetical protein
VWSLKDQQVFYKNIVQVGRTWRVRPQKHNVASLLVASFQNDHNHLIHEILCILRLKNAKVIDLIGKM